MNLDMTFWISQSFISGLDFIIFYVLAHTFMHKRLTFKKHHLLIVFFLSVLAIFAFWLVKLEMLELWHAQVISQLLTFVMLKVLAKRVSWSDAFLLYFCSNLMLILQLPALGVVGLVISARIPLFMTAQLVMLLLVIIIYKSWKLHHVFHAVRANISLKFILASLSALIVMFGLAFNFENDVVFFFIVLSTMAFASLLVSPMTIQMYQRMRETVATKDLQHDLLLTAMDMVEEHDADARFYIYADLVKRYGKDVSTYIDEQQAEDAQAFDAGQKKQAIQQLITEVFTDSDATLHTNVMYVATPEQVSYEMIHDWLKILLTEACQAMTNAPIYVSIYALKQDLMMEVAAQFAPTYVMSDAVEKVQAAVEAAGGAMTIKQYEKLPQNSLHIEMNIKIKKED